VEILKRFFIIYPSTLSLEFLLIGVEGAKTPPKMLTHFHRAWADSRKLFKVLRDQRPRWDPAGAKRRGGSPDAQGRIRSL